MGPNHGKIGQTSLIRHGPQQTKVELVAGLLPVCKEMGVPSDGRETTTRSEVKRGNARPSALRTMKCLDPRCSIEGVCSLIRWRGETSRRSSREGGDEGSCVRLWITGAVWRPCEGPKRSATQHQCVLTIKKPQSSVREPTPVRQCSKQVAIPRASMSPSHPE